MNIGRHPPHDKIIQSKHDGGGNPRPDSRTQWRVVARHGRLGDSAPPGQVSTRLPFGFGPGFVGRRAVQFRPASAVGTSCVTSCVVSCGRRVREGQ
jgi:hypothetical protein